LAKKNKEAAEADVNENTAQETEETAAEPQTQTQEQETEPEKEAAPVKSELDEQKERYLRLAAEYDNFRKRSQKEKERMYTDAQIAAVKELLPSMDNLERAVGASTEQDKDSALYKGLEMTLKQMKEQFSHLGVTEMDTAPGTAFDPNFHEAIMHDDDGSGETVIQETYSKGYLKGETVIRPALVKTRG